MADSDDELFLAAIDSFEQGRCQPAGNRAEAQPLHPLRAANAISGGGGLATAPACPPSARQAATTAAAAPAVRHLFASARQPARPLPSVLAAQASTGSLYQPMSGNVPALVANGAAPGQGACAYPHATSGGCRPCAPSLCAPQPHFGSTRATPSMPEAAAALHDRTGSTRCCSTAPAWQQAGPARQAPGGAAPLPQGIAGQQPTFAALYPALQQTGTAAERPAAYTSSAGASGMPLGQGSAPRQLAAAVLGPQQQPAAPHGVVLEQPTASCTAQGAPAQQAATAAPLPIGCGSGAAGAAPGPACQQQPGPAVQPGPGPGSAAAGAAAGSSNEQQRTAAQQQHLEQQQQPDAEVEAEADVAAAHEPPRKQSRLRQLFNYLVVYDLEATCDRDKAKQPQPQEIIELSCVIVDTSSLQLLGSFQRYIRPDQHPQLTEFCTELTGITQEMVDRGIPLSAALQQHTDWLRQQGLIGQGKTFVPVTWRDWDFKIAMAMECKWRKIETPKYMRRWVDLSAVWVKHSNKRGNLRSCVEAAGLEWEGRAHSAIDDARNTARLAVKVMQNGVILGVTGSFSGVDASGRFKQPTLLFAPAGGKGSGGGGGQQQQPARKKQRVFDEAGVWSGSCFCSVTAKKRSVKKPGPNNGREFWSCGKFTMTGGAQCDFFKFLDELGAPPAGSKKKA